ncbi:MAG: hypothetical protein ACLQU1_29740 [Bryobacteraceae bacterium]
MFARLLATFCLLNLVVSIVWGDSREPSASELVVYLSADSGQSPHVLEYMKRELGQVMQTAGYEVVWRDAHSAQPEDTASPLIVARLQGACVLPTGDLSAALPLEKAASLASTAVEGGRVLPFSSVNCGNLTRTLAPMLAAEPGARRDFLYGRAVARVLAHEFYHILLGTSEHASGGVAKPCFSPVDLLTERFEFEQATLARLQKRPSGHPSEPVVGDDATGRY